MKNERNIYLFPLFWIGLIATTYLGFGEYYMVGVSVMVCLIPIIKNHGLVRVHKSCTFFWFVMYYIIVSIIGIFTGYVGLKNFIELLLKYVILPLIIYELIPSDSDNQVKMLELLKSFIFVCCLYGFIESIMKYNFMVHIVRLNTKAWMEAMNGATNYQPCSIFLHYNYYGCVLILGLVFAFFLPYRRKIWNFIYWIILLEQILVCQSRICWIAAIALLILQIVKSKRITNTAVKRTLIIIMACVCIVIFDPGIITFIGGFIGKRFSRLWIYGFEDGSLGQRLGTLMNWSDYFQSNTIKGIVGTGYQSILVDYMKTYSFFKGYSTADCQITVYLVETGIIGIVILSGAIISFFRKKPLNCLNAQTISAVSKMALVAFCIECVTLDIVSNNIVQSLLLMAIVIFDKCQERKI